MKIARQRRVRRNERRAAAVRVMARSLVAILSTPRIRWFRLQ